MSSKIHTVSGWIDVSESMQFLPCNLSNLRGALGFGDCVEVTVNEGVRVSLSTNACESAMEESGML